MRHTDRLDTLTALRFFAAFSIVLFHLGEAPQFASLSHIRDWFALHQGVPFFFVLSGFVLTYAYPALDDRQARRRFFVARVARVWPLHIAASVLLVALVSSTRATWSGDEGGLVTLAYVCLVQSWIPLAHVTFAYNAVSWSIATEAFFYLVFPWLLTSSDRRFWPKLLATIALAMGMLGLARVFDLPLTSRDSGLTVSVLFTHPFLRLVEFATGIAAARFWLRRRTLLDGRPRLATLLEAVAVLVSLIAVSAPMLWFAERGARALVGDPFAYWIPIAGLTPIFAFVIIVFASNAGALSRVLRTRPLVLLGEMSFAIYLLHQILLRWLLTDGVAYLTRWTPSVLVLLYGVTLLALSYASWRYLEMPARRWIVSSFADGWPRVRRPAITASSSVPALSLASSSSVIARVPVAVLTIGLGGLLVSGAAWTGRWSEARPRALTLADVAASDAHLPAAGGAVSFGGRAQLVGVRLDAGGADDDILRLYWHAQTDRLTDWSIGLHAIDTAGAILDLRGVPLVPTGTAVAAGDVWRVDMTIPKTWRHPRQRVALALYRDRDLLHVDRGTHDWDARRLILPIP